MAGVLATEQLPARTQQGEDPRRHRRFPHPLPGPEGDSGVEDGYLRTQRGRPERAVRAEAGEHGRGGVLDPGDAVAGDPRALHVGGQPS